MAAGNDVSFVGGATRLAPARMQPAPGRARSPSRARPTSRAFATPVASSGPSRLRPAGELALRRRRRGRPLRERHRTPARRPARRQPARAGQRAGGVHAAHARAPSCIATRSASGCSIGCSGGCSTSLACATIRSTPTGSAPTRWRRRCAVPCTRCRLRSASARSPTPVTARRCRSPGSSPSITSSRQRRRSSRAASRPCAGRS